MGKKMFFWGGLICTLIALICFISTSAHAADYSVYTDATIDSNVLDSYLQVDQSAFSAENESSSGENADVPVTYAVTNTIYTVYDSGLPSSVYIDWATGLVKDVPLGQDYVFARTGQYQYMFAYGDFSNGFSGTATVYILQLPSNYNDSYSFYSMVDNAFNFSAGQGVVYSSLNKYPSLLGADYSRTILFSFILFCWALLALWLAKFAFESLLRREV